MFYLSYIYISAATVPSLNAPDRYSGGIYPLVPAVREVVVNVVVSLLSNLESPKSDTFT